MASDLQLQVPPSQLIATLLAELVKSQFMACR